ncbi:MAG TPA: DUF2283 domain-containing protein [Ignavibacteriaceae bacterium]|nr:DUF2283 domain-containing protein [Ignavibacteriaceae bacterium]
MKIEYDNEADAIYIQIQKKEVSTSTEIEDGVIIDFDEEKKVIGFEVLNASKKFDFKDIATINIGMIPVVS